MKLKHSIYKIGALATLVIPATTLVACGNNSNSVAKEIPHKKPKTQTKPIAVGKGDLDKLNDAKHFLNDQMRKISIKHLLPSEEKLTEKNILTNAFDINSSDQNKYFKDITITNLVLTPDDEKGILKIQMKLVSNNKSKDFEEILRYSNPTKLQKYKDDQFFKTKMIWSYGEGTNRKLLPTIFVKITDKSINNSNIDDYVEKSMNKSPSYLETFTTKDKNLNSNNHKVFVDALKTVFKVNVLPKILSDYPDLKIDKIEFNSKKGNNPTEEKFQKKDTKIPGGFFDYSIRLTKGSVTRNAHLIIYGFAEEFDNNTKWDWDQEKAVPQK